MDYLLNFKTKRNITNNRKRKVLNLIINGLPSKLEEVISKLVAFCRFKPYYKWITF